MGSVKKCCPHFCAPRGGRFQALVRSVVAKSDWFPIVAAPESTHSHSVAYQEVKVEMSSFSAVELSTPAASSQNHMT